MEGFRSPAGVSTVFDGRSRCARKPLADARGSLGVRASAYGVFVSSSMNASMSNAFTLPSSLRSARLRSQCGASTS
ncbi:MAG: hypothetical protein CHACPFDD_01344 [Phycisphaerae bacterium]|nr:hypothetical protein [Phycisphaerae bacterium]